MEKIRRDCADIAPAGPNYARAIRAGDWLFISGCTARGTDAQGG
jgi:enamine deaminase RidA (YjgF/YER057c/UK114 family)